MGRGRSESKSRSRGRRRDKSNSRSASRGRGRRDKKRGGGDSVEDWCEDNNLDDKCTGLLLSMSKDIQRQVMDEGSARECRNPSAVVMSRIRKIEGRMKGGGRGDGGRGRSRSRSHSRDRRRR
eukprot:TRINITY_DN1917_c0_g1_i1.p1 TRINITY_DN1917_c0_g1~~TRINITY_DN1917_c0_g1_i1.p1  ORF type:complete len:123 (-),score=11.88 TRINITY_DN1917_c0_g1_i1:81-449(-)